MGWQKSRWPWLDAGYLIILLTAFFYIFSINNNLSWGDDFAMYIMHAQNIVSGREYSETPYLFNSEYAYIGPRSYPPVFPLLLAPLIAIFGTRLALLKIWGVVSYILFLILFYQKLLRPSDLPKAMQLVVLGAVAFFPYSWSISLRIQSDLLLLLFVYLALFQIDRLVKDPAPKWLTILLSAGLIYLTYGTRVIGLALLPLPLLYDLIYWRKIRLAGLAVIGISTILIIIQNILIPGTGDYFNQLPHSLAQVESMSAALVKALGEIFIMNTSRLKVGIYLAILAMFGIGYITNVWKNPSIMEVFVPTYILAMMAWPYFDWLRILIPVFPMVFIYIFKGIQVILTRIHASSGVVIGVAALAAVLLATGYGIKFADPEIGQEDEIHQPDAFQLFDFVREGTPPDSGIIFFKPRAMALFTGRRSGRVNPYKSTDEVLSSLKEIKANYVIVRQNFQDSQQPIWRKFVAANASHFTLVFENNGFQAYQVR